MDIVATSGGFILDERRLWRVGPLLRFAMDLAAARPQRAPGPLRVCMVHTAGGDWDRGVAYGYHALSALPDVHTSHLALFPMPNVEDPERHLLAQDVVWVGGGSVANLLAVWRVHGLDETFRRCWQAGVVLGGVSAGSLCWHTAGTTDSYGPELRPVTNGLGLLPFSNCPHYDSESRRRPYFQHLIGAGEIPGGFATDDGVGLHFAGTELREVLAERPGAFGWQVERGPDGRVSERQLVPRLLPDRA